MGVQQKIDALPTESRELLLEALDELSRPLTLPEMNVKFAKVGMPRSIRRKLFSALKEVDVIAIVPAK